MTVDVCETQCPPCVDASRNARIVSPMNSLSYHPPILGNMQYHSKILAKYMKKYPAGSRIPKLNNSASSSSSSSEHGNGSSSQQPPSSFYKGYFATNRELKDVNNRITDLERVLSNRLESITKRWTDCLRILRDDIFLHISLLHDRIDSLEAKLGVPGPSAAPLTPISELSQESLSFQSLDKAQSQSDVRDPKLKNLDVHDVCERLAQLEGINPAELPRYHKTIQENNINGPVLLHCELDELKVVMNMKFGDWQLFRAYIVETRHKERFGHVKVEEEFIEDTMELASSRANLYLPSMVKGGSDTSGSQDSLLAEFGHLSPQEQIQYQGALQAYLDSIENQTVSVRSKIPVRRSPNTTEDKKSVEEEKYQSRIPRLGSSKHDLSSLHSGSDESLHGQPKSRSHSMEKLRQSPRPRSSTPPRDPSPRTRAKVHTVQSPSYSMKSSFRRSWSGTSPPTVGSEAKPSPEPGTDSQGKGLPRLKTLPTDFATVVIPNSESSELEDLTDMSPLVTDATEKEGQHGIGKIGRTLENIASAFRTPRTSAKSNKDDAEPLLNMEEGEGKGAASQSDSKTLTQLTHSSSGTLTEVTPLPTPDQAVDRHLDMKNPSDSSLWRRRKHIPSVSDDSPAGEKDDSGPQARLAGDKPGAVQDGRNGNGRNRSQEREQGVEDNRRNRNDNDRALRHADSYSANRPATLSTENEQSPSKQQPESFDDSSEKKKGTKLTRRESGRQKSRLPVFRTGSGTAPGQESPAGTKRQSPESTPFGSKRPSTLSMTKADLELKGSDDETAGSSGQVSITMNELASTGETVL